MFWLLRKIFSLGVLLALLFFVLQFKIGGKAVKDHLLSFYKIPLIQEISRQGKEIVLGYLRKDVGSGPAMERIEEEEKEELKRVIEREGN